MSAPMQTISKPHTVWQQVTGWDGLPHMSDCERSFKEDVRVMRKSGLWGIMREGFILPQEREQATKQFNDLFLALMKGSNVKVERDQVETLRRGIVKRLKENNSSLKLRTYKVLGDVFMYVTDGGKNV